MEMGLPGGSSLMNRGTCHEPKMAQDCAITLPWKHRKYLNSPLLSCAGFSRLRRPWEGGRRPPRKMRHQKSGMSWHSTCGKTHITPGTSFTWVLTAWSSSPSFMCTALGCWGDSAWTYSLQTSSPHARRSAQTCSPLFLLLVIREQLKPSATLLQSHRCLHACLGSPLQSWVPDTAGK